MTDFQWGQLVLMATTVGGFIRMSYIDKRNREWAQEDRRHETDQIIAKAKAEAEALRIHNDALAETIRGAALSAAANLREEQRKIADNLQIDARVAATELHQSVMTKVEEAISAGDRAYKEANHVNIKIEDLNQRLLAQGDRQHDVAKDANKVIEEIGVAGADTNIRVRAIEDATVPASGKP